MNIAMGTEADNSVTMARDETTSLPSRPRRRGGVLITPNQGMERRLQSRIKPRCIDTVTASVRS